MKHLLSFALALCLVVSMAQAQTWVSLNGPKIASNVKDITATTNGGTVFAADNSYVLKSVNTGSAWTVTPQPYVDPLLVLVKPDNANIVLAAKNGELVYNDQGGGGSSWAAKITEQDLTPLRLVAAINNNNIMLLGRTNDPNSSTDHSIWRSSDAGANWSAINQMSAETNIHDFAPYPNTSDGHGAWVGTIWACGSNPNGAPEGGSYSSEAVSSGLWSSADYGEHWSAGLLGNTNLRSVALVPYDDDNYIRLVAQVVDEGNDIVLRNTDLSKDDWANVFSEAAEVYMIRLKKSNNYVFLATSSGVWRSTDKGENWIPISEGLGDDLNVLSIAPTSTGNTVFAGTVNSLYKSTDNGDNWIDVGKMNVASFENNGDSLWAVTKDNSFASRTTNGGTAWSNAYIQSVSASFSAQQIYRNPYNSQLFVIGALNDSAKIYRSTDGGTNFNRVYNPSISAGSTFFSIGTDILSPDANLWVTGSGTVSSSWRNIFFSENGGADWNYASFTLGSGNQIVYNHIALDYTTRYAILGGGEVLKTTNSGNSWPSALSASGTGNSLAINPNNSSIVYAARSGGLWKSTNSGSSWTQVRSDNVLRVVMPYPGSSAILYALTESSGSKHVYYTYNSGASWSDYSGNLSTLINDLRAPFNAGFVYAATNRGISKFDIPPTPPQGIAGSNSSNHPRIDWNANPEADISTYNVYKSIQHCFTDDSCSDHPSEPVYLGTTANTYYVDATETIYSVFGSNDPFKKAWYTVEAVDLGSNFSGSSNSAFFLLNNDEDFGKIAHGALLTSERPKSFALSSNYPNPFNPVTQIKYGLPKDVHVLLKVYDVLGQQVAVLVNEVQDAGYKSVSFDASSYPSGVYFYRMQAGSFNAMRKMLLVK